jgi:hypothetical protein
MSETRALEKRYSTTEIASSRNSLARLNMRELKQVAEVFIESGSFTDVKQTAQAMVKIMAGAELGFTPIVSMTGIHFFNGKVSLGANLIASLIKDSGKYEYKITEHTAEACSIQFYQRIGYELKSLGVAVRCTIDDAKLAGLTGKDNWKKYPMDMLFAACVRQGARRYCADILRGLTPDTDTEPDNDVDRSAIENTTTINGDLVDTITGEVIDAEIITESDTQADDTQRPQSTQPVVPQAPTDDSEEDESEADLLARVNDLLKIKCGDGETIDEDAAKEALKGRDISLLNAAGLKKLIADLAAM